MNNTFKSQITLFHCINAYTPDNPLFPAPDDPFDLKIVHMPCSGMTKDIFMLKAFEAGADGVIVLVCPKERCRYAEGSARAKKRVQKTREILEEIDIEGHRIVILDSRPNKPADTEKSIREAAEKIHDSGPLFIQS